MTKINFVNLKKQYSKLKLEIDNAIQEVINDTAFINGKYVNKFEKEFEEKYIECLKEVDRVFNIYDEELVLSFMNGKHPELFSIK